MSCSVDGCLSSIVAKGLCKKHYQRMRRNGSPEVLRGRGAKKKHGMIRSSEYHSWCAMKSRCSNPNNEKYEQYGGRGIAVCDRWRDSFLAFYEDMGPKPAANYSIDRKDNGGGYEPSNCRWATQSEQCSNKRATVLYEYNGKSRTLTQWAKEIGVPRETLRGRVKRYGYTIEEALTVKPHQNKRKIPDEIMEQAK